MTIPVFIAHWASMPPEAVAYRQDIVPLGTRALSPFLIYYNNAVSPSFAHRTSPFDPPANIPHQYMSSPVPSRPSNTSRNASPVFSEWSPAISQTPLPMYTMPDPWTGPNMSKSPALDQPGAWNSPYEGAASPSYQSFQSPANSPLLLNMLSSPVVPNGSNAIVQTPGMLSTNGQFGTNLYIPSFMSPGPAANNATVLRTSQSLQSFPQRTLSPELQSYLTPQDQARFVANAAPASYDVVQRAHILSLSQQIQQTMPGYTVDSSGRARRRSLPTPTPPVTQTGKIGALIQDHQAQARIPQKPLRPQRSQSAQPNGFLDTIGEDGESQAGTLRLRDLPRSSSSDAVRSVKAIRAATVDEEGNTSATLLEDLVDAQERTKEYERSKARTSGLRRSTEPDLTHLSSTENMASPSVDKILPQPPSPNVKNNKRWSRPNLVQIFAQISPRSKRKATAPEVDKTNTPEKPVTKLAEPRTSMENSISPRKSAECIRPAAKTSQSDSLLALEKRLSRPSSPNVRAKQCSDL